MMRTPSLASASFLRRGQTPSRQHVSSRTQRLTKSSRPLSTSANKLNYSAPTTGLGAGVSTNTFLLMNSEAGRYGRPSSTRAFSAGPKAAYEQLLKDGKINKDQKQEKIVKKLEELHLTIKDYTPVEVPLPAIPAASPSSSDSGGGFFGGLFGGGGAKETPKKKVVGAPSPVEPKINYTAPRGLYVWGGCGSGKSFLMDLFYDTQTHIEKKRRVHFHEWMIEVHDRIHAKTQGTGAEKAETEWTAESAKAQRESLKAGGGSQVNKANIMEAIADDMVAEAWLFCFDEFQVTHISDAMIMKQLFSIMFRKGAVVVSTSNRPPPDLYLNGLNRSLFLPFIPLLEERCQVIDIASEVDYRLQTTYAEDAFQVFYSPKDEKNQKFFDDKFQRWTRGETEANIQMEVKGHKFDVKERGTKSSIARFDFADLCDKPLGAGDYITIGKTFHTVFIDNIPSLTLQERDQVRRFITLIDALYEVRTKMVLLAENRASEIFFVDPSIDKKTAVQDEIFAWDRTVSRLTEMSDVDYLRGHAQRLTVSEFWNQYSLTEFEDEEIDEIWYRFDVDDTGHLTKRELRDLFNEVYTFHDVGESDHLSDSDFDLVFSAFDLDQNGIIDKDEFRSYAKKYNLSKIPPYVVSSEGAKPELTVGSTKSKNKSAGGISEIIKRRKSMDGH